MTELLLVVCVSAAAAERSPVWAWERHCAGFLLILTPSLLPPSLPHYLPRPAAAAALLLQVWSSWRNAQCCCRRCSHHHSTKTTPPPDLQPHHHHHNHPAGVRVWLNSPVAPRDPWHPYLYRWCPPPPPLTRLFSHNGASLSPQYKWTRVSAFSAAFQTERERKTSAAEDWRLRSLPTMASNLENVDTRPLHGPTTHKWRLARDDHGGSFCIQAH